MRTSYIISFLQLCHHAKSHTDVPPVYTTEREDHLELRLWDPLVMNDDCTVPHNKLDRRFGYLSPYDLSCPTDPAGLESCCWCVWTKDFIQRISRLQKVYDDYELRLQQGRWPAEKVRPYKPPKIDPRTYHAPFEVDQVTRLRESRYDYSQENPWKPISFRCRTTLTLEEWVQYWPEVYRDERKKNEVPLVTRSYRVYCRPDESWFPFQVPTKRQYILVGPSGHRTSDPINTGYCKFIGSRLTGESPGVRHVERVPESFKKAREVLRTRKPKKRTRPSRSKTVPEPKAHRVRSKHIEVAPGTRQCVELEAAPQLSEQGVILLARAEAKNTRYDLLNQAMQWPSSREPAKTSEISPASPQVSGMDLNSGLPDSFHHVWPDLRIDPRMHNYPSEFNADEYAVNSREYIDVDWNPNQAIDAHAVDDMFDLNDLLQLDGEFAPIETDMWPGLQINDQASAGSGTAARSQQRTEASDITTIQRLETVPPAYINSLSIIADSNFEHGTNTHVLSHGVGPANRIYYESDMLPAAVRSRKRPASDIDRNMQSAPAVLEWDAPSRNTGKVQACLDHGGRSSQSASFYAEVIQLGSTVDAYSTARALEFPQS